MNIFKKYKQEILYMAFGCVVTVVNWAVYSLLVTVFNVGVTLSNAVAWFLAVIVAFITNKLYVFESRSKGLRALSKEVIGFFMTRTVTGLLDVFLPTILIGLGLNGALFGIDGFYAKLVVNGIVIILNYLFSKLLIFK